MRSFVFIFVIILISRSLSLNAQTSKECRKLLKKKINIESVQNEPDVFLNDYKTLLLCEFDAIDYQIFMGPEKDFLFASTILGTIIIGASNNVNGLTDFTFNEVFIETKKIMEAETYVALRNYVIALNKLSQKYPNLETWTEDSTLLISMGSDPEQISKIKSIIIENNFSNWQDVLAEFKNSENRKLEIDEAAKPDEEIDKEKIILVKGLYTFTNYDTGIRKSKASGKPVLLFFSGFACVNCREMERGVLRNQKIQNVISEKFELVTLYVDDKTAMPANKVHYSDCLQKEIQNVGQLNFEIQNCKFGTNGQPFFVILSPTEIECNRSSFTSNVEEFLKFLNDCLSQ